jgi:hypothetical protein
MTFVGIFSIVTVVIFLSSCMTNKGSNAIEELGEEVIKKKEGIDIRLIPIQEEKKENKQ